MATMSSKSQGRSAALRDLLALAKRLQRQLDRRRRLAASTVTQVERDLRALAGLLAKRAGAVRTDVEKHLRGLRRDLARQMKVSALARPRRRAARSRKKK